MVEGGKADSIESWAQAMRDASTKTAEELQKERGVANTMNGQNDDGDSRPPSSGLSSLSDGDLGDVDMVDLAS
jgi:hypothetical protein